MNILIVNPIGPGAFYGQAARKMGLKPYALFTIDEIPPYLLKSFDPNLYFEVLRADEIDNLEEYFADYAFKAIIPGEESSIPYTDALAASYSLPGSPRRTSRNRINKTLMKAELERVQIPCAKYFQSDELDTIEDWVKEIGLPVVIKPPQARGSQAVKVCKTMQEVREAFHEVATLDGMDRKQDELVLAEEYLDGEEYFVNLIHEPGKQPRLCSFARYEKLQSEGYASIYKNIFSLPLDCPQALAAYDYAVRVNKALDVKVGINDTEVKFTSKGIKLIEVNNRLPGANTPYLIEKCSGLACYDANIALFMGQELSDDLNLEFSKHYCICCLISTEEGVVASITGLDVVQGLSSFDSMRLFVSEGDQVSKTTNLITSWGLVFLVHDDPETLRRQANAVHNALKMIIKTPSAKPAYSQLPPRVNGKNLRGSDPLQQVRPR